MSFFKPFSSKISEIPVIIYPESGIERMFNRAIPNTLENYLTELYSKNNLQVGDYHIVILWCDGSDKMVDIWIFEGVKNSQSNPNGTVRNFRNNLEYKNESITAGDGLILLGKEEGLRRTSEDIESFVFGVRPVIPFDIIKNENYYLA